MLMSATMPKFLRNHFLDLLDSKCLVVAEELMERQAMNGHTWIPILRV